MHDGTALDLGMDPSIAAQDSRRITPRLVWALAALAALAIGALQVAGGPGFGGLMKALGFNAPARAEATVRVSLEARRAVASLTEGRQAVIVVEGDAAKERNALIPISGAPLQQARSFLIGQAVAGSGAGPLGNALTCLTQAVYYEAANEPMTGRRAVAQVVLNRMRHPAYPKSVCGVVYQGWQRNTGCQFSFTCDGSLHRGVNDSYSWDRARRVAEAALSGSVYRPVGLALNYHTTAISPYWAPSLVPQTVVGAHIFYRRPGHGTVESFTQTPADYEPDAAPARVRYASARQSSRSARARYEPLPVLEIPVVERPMLYRASGARRSAAASSSSSRPVQRAAAVRSGPRTTVQGGVRITRGSSS